MVVVVVASRLRESFPGGAGVCRGKAGVAEEGPAGTRGGGQVWEEGWMKSEGLL